MSASESRSPGWRCRTKALLFIALLMFDMPGARAVRSDLLDDTGMSDAGTSLRDQIEDPFEQYVEHRGFVQEHLDKFGAYTGLIPEHRKEAFKKAVSYIISDDEIFQAAQFAVCVRTSPTPLNDETPDDVEVRCTPAVDILDSTEGRTSARRMSLYNVYNELLGLVDKLDEPRVPAFNLPWSQNDEHQEKDDNFAEYFHAYANFEAARYNKPSLGRENEIMKDVLRFPMKFQFKKAGEEEEDSDEEEEQEWPPYLPDMESRYMLCFGELAAPGKMEFSGEAVKKACTGFWNKDITKDAIAGLGADLRKENMEQTMFRVRSEILFGKKEGEGDQSLESTFHLLAGAGSNARSARGVAEAVARLVRERIAVTGISCPRCVAEALGISSTHDQAASLTETAEGSSALVEANESAFALSVAARSQPPVFAMPPMPPVAPVAPVVHHAAPAFQVITPGLVNPAGQHVAVQAAGHAHVGQLVHGAVQVHAHFGGVVTHYVPVTQVLSSGLKGGWHFVTHGGHQVIKMKAAGAKSCMGLFHLKGGAAVTTDIGLKLAMKKGVLCLATKVVTHGTAAGVASVTPWAAISAALTVHIFGITIPAALVVSAVVLVSFATHFGAKWISDRWKNRMTQTKLKEWQLLVRSSAITAYWVARA
mmetsp:Transcript_126694/g.370189  ORF Transcript_126694/g.370189 Transcript_126694/m.370189 type:complete len:649 (-) Transcript_126694:74-2020(-)